MTAIIDLIKVAEVPWCGKLREIIKESLKYRHHLTEIIKTEVEHEPLYRVLKRSSYNLQDVAIDDNFDVSFFSLLYTVIGINVAVRSISFYYQIQ